MYDVLVIMRATSTARQEFRPEQQPASVDIGAPGHCAREHGCPCDTLALQHCLTKTGSHDALLLPARGYHHQLAAAGDWGTSKQTLELSGSLDRLPKLSGLLARPQCTMPVSSACSSVKATQQCTCCSCSTHSPDIAAVCSASGRHAHGHLCILQQRRGT